MTRKVLYRSSNIVRHESSSSSLKDEKIDVRRDRRKFSEVAGGSAAECTAVCCCGPLTVANLAIFTVYKMPAGLCRKAINRRKQHRKLKKKYLIHQRRAASDEFTDGSVGPAIDTFEAFKPIKDVADVEELMKLEEEMWNRFDQTGFMRTSSQ